MEVAVGDGEALAGVGVQVGKLTAGQKDEVNPFDVFRLAEPARR